MDMKDMKKNFFWTKLKWCEHLFPIFSRFNLWFPFVQQVLVIKLMTLSGWVFPRVQNGSGTLWDNIKEQEGTEFMT